MSSRPTRRRFLKTSALSATGLGLAGWAGLSPADLSAGSPAAHSAPSNPVDPPYKISLAEWSLHRALFGGEMDHMDFAQVTKRDYGIDAVEYVNQFFMDKAEDQAYLREMKTRAKGEGVESRLIMCDGEGALGDPDESKRQQAVENHHKWVEAADYLGCDAIRVNARSSGSYEEQMQRAADGLRRLCEFAEGPGIDVIVENHGELSSNGQWLAGVIQAADHPLAGTLPDFGNFCVRYEDTPSERRCVETYDRYQGVEEMMPYAKAVSAKTLAFGQEGQETSTDYARMMRIVTGADSKARAFASRWTGVAAPSITCLPRTALAHRKV